MAQVNIYAKVCFTEHYLRFGKRIAWKVIKASFSRREFITSLQQKTGRNFSYTRFIYWSYKLMGFVYSLEIVQEKQCHLLYELQRMMRTLGLLNHEHYVAIRLSIYD